MDPVRERKLLVWLLALVAVPFLPLATFWAAQQPQVQAGGVVAPQGMATLARATADLREHSARLEEALLQIEARRAQLESRYGDYPESWSYRRLEIRGQRMSRQSADALLRQLHTRDDASVLAESIQVAVAGSGAGLFAADKGHDAPNALVITVEADLYGRAGDL